MDLLANYADDTSDNQNLELAEKAADTESDMVFSHLEAEWESFEKMMGDDLLVKSAGKMSSDTATAAGDSIKADEKFTEELKNPVRLSTGEEANSGHDSVSSANDDRSSSKSSASYDSESDEDDKEEKPDDKGSRKRHCSESSTSSSTNSDVSEVSTGKPEKGSESMQEGSEKMASDKGTSERKVASRRSRSRSRSMSPSRKHRRSSDRSIHHRSSTRHSHARHERKRTYARHSRSRSRSRDRHSRRHSSRERRHYSTRDRQHHRRSRSRDRHHRHRHHPESGARRGKRSSLSHGDRRKPDVDKRRSRSRSPERKEGESGEKKITPRSFGAGSGGGSGEGGPSETGARVMYRTAGIKFGHAPGASKPQTFKEQMRQNLIKMWSENMASCTGGDPSSGAPTQPSLMQINPQSVFTNMPIQSAGLGVQALCTITPQMAFMQTVAAMQKKAEEITGVSVPKYYNPAAVNPMKYAEQVQKRKLLWSKSKDKKETDNQWHAQALVADGDSKTAAKFRKLMGIKEEEGKEVSATAGASSEDDSKFLDEQRKKQEELFNQLDKEYHFARIATHTQRGAGLGFGSQGAWFH